MVRKNVVRAAGGVISRRGANGKTEVLLVYRSREPSDWTFPKGKAEAGETDEMCALREVHEETDLFCTLKQELPSVSYLDRNGQMKRVRYWAMRVLKGTAAPSNEVAAVCWLDIESARERLTYQRDRELLAAFANLVASGEK